jgi:transcription termination/antitermination protein NusG
MTDENMPVADEKTPHSTPASEEEIASGEGTSYPEIPHEPAAVHETKESPGTEGSQPTPAETEADSVEAETPKTSAKKPRKSSKTAAAESITPTEAPPVTTASTAPVAAGVALAEPPPESTKKWYVVKVQSGREDSIKAAVERKVKIEGLEEFFGQIAIPVEELIQKKSVRVTDKKTGDKVTQEKKVIKYQKKFPGYLFAEVEFNDRILYLFRETSGVGDFVGASLKRDPTPMTDREVRAMLTGVAEGDPGKPNQGKKVKLDYEKGDKVKIRDGAFANMEGVVKSISETKETGETPKVEVVVTIFGRPVEVVLDYWHVDKT